MCIDFLLKIRWEAENYSYQPDKAATINIFILKWITWRAVSKRYHSQIIITQRCWSPQLDGALWCLSAHGLLLLLPVIKYIIFVLLWSDNMSKMITFRLLFWNRGCYKSFILQCVHTKQTQHGLHTHSIKQMLVPRVRTETGKKDVERAATSSWNKVKTDLKPLTTVRHFKSNYKGWWKQLSWSMWLFVPLYLLCIITTRYCVHSFVACDSCICFIVVTMFLRF